MSDDLEITVTYRTVSDLIDNFRDSLLALTPSLDKADVPWHDEEAYEHWEEIAAAIFDGIVTYTLEKHFDDGQNFAQRFANYSFYYKDYSNKSFIEIATDNPDDPDHYVFLGFKTKEKQFDTVVCNQINSYGKIKDEGIEFKYEGLKFLYKHREFSGIMQSYELLK
jgi:hypothetical protein